MSLAGVRDQRVLVTGAGGFIGTVVCRILTAQGAEVHGVGRSIVDPDIEMFTYYSIDLTHSKSTNDLVDRIRPHFIIHLAGCSIARRELVWVQETFAENLLTTVNVLTAAQQVGVGKTIIAGSLEQPDVFSENPILTSPYAASKWAATGYSQMFHTVYGTQVATARIFMVYGPGQKELQKMIPYVCLAAISGKVPQLMSGTRLVDWVYVDDVAEGLVRMLVDGPGDGSLVDIGTGRLVSTSDVAELICHKSGLRISAKIGAMPDRAMEQIRRADIERTTKFLGWRPKTTLEEGLDRTVVWYKQMHEDS